MMEIVELKEVGLQMGLSLVVTVITMGYMLSMMALGRVTAEIIYWILDWRRKEWKEKI